MLLAASCSANTSRLHSRRRSPWPSPGCCWSCTSPAPPATRSASRSPWSHRFCALYSVLTRRLLLDDSSLNVVLAQQAAALVFAVALATAVEVAGGLGWDLGGHGAGTGWAAARPGSCTTAPGSGSSSPACAGCLPRWPVVLPLIPVFGLGRMWPGSGSSRDSGPAPSPSWPSTSRSRSVSVSPPQSNHVARPGMAACSPGSPGQRATTALALCPGSTVGRGPRSRCAVRTLQRSLTRPQSELRGA